MKKIYSLGANCVSTKICETFNCERSFFDWAVTPCPMDAFYMIYSNDSVRTIIEGQRPSFWYGNSENESERVQFIVDNITFAHYRYKDINDTTALVRRLCRIKNSFGDFENNYFIYTLINNKYISNPSNYIYGVAGFGENFITRRMFEDNVIILNPYGLDIPYLKDFKHIYTEHFNIEPDEMFKKENVNLVVNWARDILLKKFPALYETGRTQKQKVNSNQIPTFFYDIYNSVFDYDEFLYNVNNLGIVKYLLEKNYEVESNRNYITFYNKYFSITASNLTELWIKITDFCQKSVDFNDNFCLI